MCEISWEISLLNGRKSENEKAHVLSFSVYLYVAPLASHTMSDATMLEGSNMGFSFTDLRPFNRDMSHEISHTSSEGHLQSQATLQNRLLCHL